ARDLDEAELLVVVGADPFGGVERALLQRRIDVAGGELLRHGADLGHDRPTEAADAEFQALEVVNAFDLLAEPTAHLAAGVAGGETDTVVILQQIIEQIFAAAEAQPRNHLPAVEAERQRGPESEGRILAPIIIKRCVPDLDRPILHSVEHLQAGHDLARREGLDLEFVVCDLGNTLGKIFAAAIERIERLWTACCQPPFDLRAGLRDRWCSNRGRSKAQARSLQEFTTFHGVSPVMSNRPRQGTPSRPHLPRTIDAGSLQDNLSAGKENQGLNSRR